MAEGEKCTACGRLYEEHFHETYRDETRIYCNDHTTGDIFTTEPTDDMIIDTLRTENKALEKKIGDGVGARDQLVSIIKGKDGRISNLEGENKALKADNERLQKRDLNASIQLCYDNGINPFAREDLLIVDVGYADNSYVVESKTVKALQDKNKALRDALQEAQEYLQENRRSSA